MIRRMNHVAAASLFWLMSKIYAYKFKIPQNSPEFKFKLAFWCSGGQWTWSWGCLILQCFGWDQLLFLELVMIHDCLCFCYHMAHGNRLHTWCSRPLHYWILTEIPLKYYQECKCNLKVEIIIVDGEGILFINCHVVNNPHQNWGS